MTVADGVVGGGVEVTAGVVTENQSSHAHNDGGRWQLDAEARLDRAARCCSLWRAMACGTRGEEHNVVTSMLNAVVLPIAMMSIRAALLDGSDVMRGSAAAQAETATLAADTPARTGDRRRT
jgi:hypothetical protein